MYQFFPVIGYAKLYFRPRISYLWYEDGFVYFVSNIRNFESRNSQSYHLSNNVIKDKRLLV